MAQQFKISRQRRWQLKMIEQGRCIICGQPKCAESKYYCTYHLLYVRAHNAAKRHKAKIATPAHERRAVANQIRRGRQASSSPPVCKA